MNTKSLVSITLARFGTCLAFTQSVQKACAEAWLTETFRSRGKATKAVVKFLF
jgi:hypothetical protein